MEKVCTSVCICLDYVNRVCEEDAYALSNKTSVKSRYYSTVRKLLVRWCLLYYYVKPVQHLSLSCITRIHVVVYLINDFVQSGSLYILVGSLSK